MTRDSEIQRLVKEVINGDESTASLVNDLLLKCAGNFREFFYYLIDEKLTGASLFHLYEVKCAGNLYKFVAFVNELRTVAALGENVSKIYPDIKKAGPLDNEDFHLLQDLGINALMAERLQWVCKRLGMSYSDIAREIDVPRTTVRDWCRGKATFQLLQIVRFLRWLRLKLNDPSIDLEWLVATPVDTLGKSIHAVFQAVSKREARAEVIEGQQDLLDGVIDDAS